MTDVAIVGGGPAGSAAAYFLARRGARVTIFDPSHPREKPCGGGVTGRALAIVSDALAPEALPATAIRRARFESAYVPLAPGALVVTSRTAFDAALLAAAVRAGVTVDTTRVVDVSVDSGGVNIQTTGGARRAQFVVGADGANSLVRRRLAAPFARGQLSIGAGYFVHGVTSDDVAIEFVENPPGYIWSFPRVDHLAVGVCAHADAGASALALRARAARWLASSGVARGVRLQPYSWPIPSLSTSDLERPILSGDRWLLAGDAAGLVDPITREGIFFAVASGRWAAEALLGARPSHAYASRVRDEAIGELMEAARLKAGFFRPAFTRLLLKALGESAAVRAVMADLVAGRQSYSTLTWRLLKTLELRLAWRVLVKSA